MSTLPHRFSESAFRKYEQPIAQITGAFPLAVAFDPRSFSVASETFRGRLRDAVTSYTDHAWTSAHIRREKFLSIIESNALVISIRPDGMVVAGTRESIKNANNDVHTAFTHTDVLDVTWLETVTPETLNLLCALAHNGALKKQLLVTLDPETIPGLLEQYDVAITLHKNNNYIIS